jgi:hypothetical protein
MPKPACPGSGEPRAAETAARREHCQESCLQWRAPDRPGQSRCRAARRGIKVASIYLNDGFTASGTIWFESAVIRRSADLAPEKPADGVTGLDATHVQIAGTLNWTPAAQVDGVVSLQGAAAGQLVDDWGSGRDNAFWPAGERLRFDGFTYGRLGGAEPATIMQRLAWIRSQYRPKASEMAAPFAAQPYEQLASVYRTRARMPRHGE